jgi:spermidine/putrescine transport system permease protein
MSSAAEERLQRQSARNGWLLSMPALVLLMVAAIGPLIVIVIYSFLTPGQYGNVVWEFSWDGWVSILFTRDIFDGTLGLADAHMTIFWRSVKLSIMTTVVAFALGFPTAWFIATRPAKQRALWLFLITIPFWTNLLIRTFAIMEVIRAEGVLNTALIWVGIIDTPLAIIYTDTAVLIGMAYVYLPLMVLPLFAAIDRFDMRLLEAGYDLYASRWQVLRRVILPIVKPGIVAGSILVFVPSLGAYVTPRVLGGGKNMMIGNFIELQFLAGRNWPLGAALVTFSFNAGNSVAVWQGFSLHWYTEAWDNQAVKDAAGRSLIIAVCAAVISTTVATLAAMGTTRRARFKGETFIYVAINQPLMVPEIVTAVALMILFGVVKEATGYQGLGYLILAHSAFCIPFAYLPIRARLEGMDLSLETAAGDLYATPWQTFRHVTLPLLGPGILAGAMLAFVISLDDVIITEFVKSGGQDTLPTYMLGQLRRTMTPEVNAISTALLALTVVLLTIFFLLTRKRD